MKNAVNRRLLTKYLLTLPFVGDAVISAKEKYLKPERVIEVCPGEFFEVPDNWDVIYSKSISHLIAVGSFEGKSKEYRMNFFRTMVNKNKYLCPATKYKSLKEFENSFNEMQKLSRILNGRLFVDGYKIGMFVV
jgi:hypothetical protein